MDTCTCGFDDRSVAIDEIDDRSSRGVAEIIAILRADPTTVQRPAPDRWSALEYAAHVRDVLLLLRDRTVIGLVEDNPTFAPLYRDERIQLALYRADTPAGIATELDAARTMFVRLFGELDAVSLERPVRYGHPDPTTRTVGWMGKQAVHEVEHHLDDIRRNAVVLSG